LVFVATGAAAQSAPVRIDSGLVQGALGRDSSIDVYRGIPFAAPPVGELRFRPPEPVAPWTGIKDATRAGPVCPQPEGPGTRGFTVSEDCLNLNIWTAAKPGEKRPVYVWIYGGGFLQGTGASPQFDGEGLAKKGVVVVTFNYRTGALGFLATPELSRESGQNASGNYGLLDDIALLQWVRRNIAAFGGDPARVTIGGQSAGAGSAGFLSISPLAKGLFQRAILQSHARHPGDPDLRFLSVSYRRKGDAEAAGAAYAKTRGAFSLTELRALPWQKLVEGSDAVDEGVETGTTARPPLFRPVIDGWVLPRGYGATLGQRTQNKVLVIAGNNADETGAVPETAFAPLRAQTGAPRAGSPQINVTLLAYRAFGARKFGAMAHEFFRLYPATSDDEAARASNAAARDNNRVTTWLWAGLWTPGTKRPVYTYFWTHAPPGPDTATRGAYHGSEINYAFGNLDANNRPWTDADRAIAERMSSYWANIIKTGNPNGPGLPIWPQWRGASPTVMELGREWKPVPVAMSASKIDFWRRFYRSQAQW
jgi:carboxylesterase type B